MHLAISRRRQPTTSDGDEPDGERPIRVAVVGRPNVGKSTLINALLGEQRLIAFDQPGTTRDSIEIEFEYDGQTFTLIDTAGIRRRGKVFETVEKFSVVKTLQSIADCNVVILLLDAASEIADQDAHIAGFVLESGRALVVAVNKWDGLDAYQRERITREIERKLHFLSLGALSSGFGAQANRAEADDAIGDARRIAPRLSTAAHAQADARTARRGGAAAARARRTLAPETALCAPGRPQSADHRGARQFAEPCGRHRIGAILKVSFASSSS